MKTPTNKLLTPVLAAILLFGFAFQACQKDNDKPNDKDSSENHVFYEFMQEWYYWNTLIPNIDPDSYSNIHQVLEAIRYKELDRWSYIADYQEYLAFFQESRFIGHGFGTAWDAQEKLRINYVFHDTEAYEKGVRRSWIIEAINNKTVTPADNIIVLLGANEAGKINSFRFVTPEGDTVELELEKHEVVMNSVLHHEIIDLDGIRVGYMVLQGFTEPTLQEIHAVFENFLSEDIQELILDLRYNGGGRIDIANYLSSIIGGSKVEDQVFSHFSFNNLKAEEENSTYLFEETGYSLNINRLITICTPHTASASEMIINSLRPFMDVYVVGNHTYGKPMGMSVFNYANKYALVPITFKITNANNEGDYFDGIPVNIPAEDDLSKMFGDVQETSLEHALYFIQSGISKGVPAHTPYYVQPRDQMQGLRAIIGSH